MVWDLQFLCNKIYHVIIRHATNRIRLVHQITAQTSYKLDMQFTDFDPKPEEKPEQKQKHTSWQIKTLNNRENTICTLNMLMAYRLNE